IKVDYAASKGLAGTMIWSENMDYNNELVNVAVAFGSGSAARRDVSTKQYGNNEANNAAAEVQPQSSAPAPMAMPSLV
ncbi:hypothetical protein H4217_000502, partial [Coemansia sp. RSA 1939]